MHNNIRRYPLVVCVAALALLATSTFPARGASGDGGDFPGPRTRVYNVTFVAFDTETTGLNPKTERIVEVGAVKFKNGEVIDQKSWLINPGKKIPPWVRKVHGISDDMVKDQPTFEAFYPEFESFIGNAVLMAHQATFDVSFLREEIVRNQLDLPGNQVIDSLKLFRLWLPDKNSYTLTNLAKELGIDGGEFHRALSDSVYVMLIFQQLLEDQNEKIELGTVFDDAHGAMTFE